MEKQAKIFTQLSTGLLVCLVAAMALFWSSCKKKEMLEDTLSTYNVTFDSRGGSAVSVIKVKQGESVALSANPTKKGFIFDGWYTDKEANIAPFSATTTITADLTLYAKWNVGSFSLSSASFTDGGEIPPKYAYDNKKYAGHLNISPQLSWVNAPKGTLSFLIIMQAADAENYNEELFYQPNWYVYNIPANKTSLEENETSIRKNSCSYVGPFGLEGKNILYRITIYALKLPKNYFNFKNGNALKYPPKSEEDAENKLKGHILASASITGTFIGK